MAAMIQVIGFLIGVYILARCIAGATENPNGSVHGIGRFAYVVAFVVSSFLLYALATSGVTAPHY
jgi:divalent metal cation (Fe/Co/Zn/Cd) transporter